MAAPAATAAAVAPTHDESVATEEGSNHQHTTTSSSSSSSSSSGVVGVGGEQKRRRVLSGAREANGSGSSGMTDEFFLGLVVGLAAYNNILVDLPLPPAVYKCIQNNPKVTAASGSQASVSVL